VAGIFYALGNILTREWCADETPEALTLVFFAVMGGFGLIGLAVLSVYPLPVPEGAAGFVVRGWVTPSLGFLGLTLLQAVGSLIGVALMMRAYLIADASRVSVFEYLNLPTAAIWGWILWREVQSPPALIGMALIAFAGAMIAVRGRQPERATA
jgi:drug/metabolite transporter (DMT)-like permease